MSESAPAVKPEETAVVDAPKPVEEAPAADAPVDATAAPAPETAVKSVEDTPAATEEPPAEEKKDEGKTVPEVKPITHGTLSKNHGGLLSFFKQKRFFFFQDEAIAEENLKAYLHKDNSSKATAAYATQTGKGLWFYTKDEAHKEAPHGIIKLADVTEIVEYGAYKFVLKLTTGDLHFEASPAERNSWVFTLKSKIEEAKSSEETVTGSEAYKATFEKLSKPAVLAIAKPHGETKETEEAKPEEGGADKATESAPEETVASDGETGLSDAKGKGRKRGSIFDPFFPKKEKVIKKKDETEEAKEDKSVDADAPVAPAVAEPAATEPAPEATTEEAKPAEEGETKTDGAVSPKGGKRGSFFGGLFKKEVDAAAAAVAAAAAEVAPESKPVEETAITPAATETPATEPAEPVAAITETLATGSKPSKFLAGIFEKRAKSPGPKTADEKAAEVPEVKLEANEPPVEEEVLALAEEAAVAETAASPNSPKEKRKSSFFGFKKEKKEEVKSDSEDEPASKPIATSPLPKGGLLGLMRKASLAGRRAAEPKEVATPASTAVAEEELAKTPAVPETAEPVKTDEKPAEQSKAEAAPAVGDVPGAVTVGQTPVVKATA